MKRNTIQKTTIVIVFKSFSKNIYHVASFNLVPLSSLEARIYFVYVYFLTSYYNPHIHTSVFNFFIQFLMYDYLCNLYFLS